MTLGVRKQYTIRACLTILTPSTYHGNMTAFTHSLHNLLCVVVAVGPDTVTFSVTGAGVLGDAAGSAVVDLVK